MTYPSELNDQQWRMINELLLKRRSSGFKRKSFTKLHHENIFEKINVALVKKVRLHEGRDPSPSLVCIDSQSLKADANVDCRGIDGNKKVNDRKRYLVSDALGLILYCTATAANVAVVHPGRECIEHIKSQPRIEKVLVDSEYLGIRGKHGNFVVEVSSKKDGQTGFVPLYKRWVIERTNAWNTRQRRLAKDHEYRSDHQGSIIFVGIIGMMLRRLA